MYFCLPDVSITSRDAKVPNYKSIIYFFRFYQWLPDIYWHLVIGHKHINVISQNWLLYHFAMPLCIHDHFLCSEFFSIGNQYNYSSFTLRSVNVVYLIASLQSICVFIFKWNYFGKHIVEFWVTSLLIICFFTDIFRPFTFKMFKGIVR